MGKPSSIKTNANTIWEDTSRIEAIASQWLDGGQLRNTARELRKARHDAVTGLLAVLNSCEKLKVQTQSSTRPFLDAELVRGVRRLEQDCDWVAKECATFQGHLQYLSQHSTADTREARSTVENNSQENVVWKSAKLHRLATKMLQAFSRPTGAGIEEEGRSPFNDMADSSSSSGGGTVHSEE